LIRSFDYSNNAPRVCALCSVAMLRRSSDPGGSGSLTTHNNCSSDSNVQFEETVRSAVIANGNESDTYDCPAEVPI